jgi:hypothetical protein
MLHRASDLAGSCEHCNGSSGSIKVREFLDYLSDYQLLKKDSALWSQLLHSVKAKVNLSLYLTKHHSIKIYLGVEVAPYILDLGTIWR